MYWGEQSANLFLCSACHILKTHCFRWVYQDRERGLMSMRSVLKVQIASKAALLVATPLSQIFNPVFLKTCGKHLKKCKSGKSGISSNSSNPQAGSPMGGITHQCSVLYVGTHSFSV